MVNKLNKHRSTKKYFAGMFWKFRNSLYICIRNRETTRFKAEMLYLLAHSSIG